MRTYERTHPWIRFDPLNLERLSPSTWLLLGEAQSKCAHIAGTPLQPAVAQSLHRLYLAKGVAATTAIEGNTLSAEAVARIVAASENPHGAIDASSATYQEREVANVVAAVNAIGERLRQGETIPLTPQRIADLNRSVLEGLPLPAEVVPGRVRQHSVGVATYRGAPWEDCDLLLARFCQWLDKIPASLFPGAEIATALLKAVLAHVYLAWIHAYGDGNGRTARLVEFQILVSAGMPTPAAHLLSNHYNETRPEYYRQLDRTSRSGGDLAPFVAYAVAGFVEQVRRQIQEIRSQVWRVSWRDYVFERFRGRESSSGRRQRQLLLALSWKPPVPKNQIATLDAEMALSYRDRNTKTLSRDLNELIRMELIEKVETGYRARVDRILAFLPFRKRGIDDRTEPQATAATRLRI